MIADATRDGRREEFASFTSFAAEEIPDPQDPETFERSKLTRKSDSDLADLYARLLEVRKRLPPAEPDAIEFDEEEQWLRVSRGRFDLLANFSSSKRRRVQCSGTDVVLATHGEPAVVGGAVELEPMSGALVA